MILPHYDDDFVVVISGPVLCVHDEGEKRNQKNYLILMAFDVNLSNFFSV
jgi:hypothetical protein